MIGNDIVDLVIAKKESNFKRKGFAEKVFTTEEQKLINESKNSFEMAWRIWSMKESAYKIYTQKYPGRRFFSPAKFNCFVLDKSNGVVEFADEKYFTRSVKNLNYIYTEAKTIKNIRSSTNSFYIHGLTVEKQSLISRLKLSFTGSKLLGIKPGKLIIKSKSSGMIQLKYNNKTLPNSCSISHHGSYGVVTILE